MPGNALKKINQIVRTLKNKHPGMKHSSAIKQASAIYRKDRGQVSGMKKKKHSRPGTHHKSKSRGRVGSAKRKTTGTDRTDNKKVSVTIGGLSVAKARKYIRDEAEEKLAWGLLAAKMAKNKTERKKQVKKNSGYFAELRKFK